MENFTLFQAIMWAVLLGISCLVLWLHSTVVTRPRRLRSVLLRQGIKGPPPSLFLGNLLQMKRERDKATISSAGAPISHNVEAAIFPFFSKWRKEYGDVYMFAMGREQIVVVTQEEMVRDLSICTSMELGKPLYQVRERGALLGRGILTANGHYWAQQRKLIAPELYMDKVKGMTKLIQESAVELVDSWKSIIAKECGFGQVEIKIDQPLRSYSADVLSKACFGTNYSQGEQIFAKLRALKTALSRQIFATTIPFFRHVPTKENRKIWALEEEIKVLILNVVKRRREGGGAGQEDLLQALLEGARNGGELSQEAIDSFLLDNCKNIYLAGYETTAATAIWCLMLLASHPDWLDRVRAEVLDISRGQIPDGEMLRKMKLLSMTINETLRLYPQVTVMSREAFKDLTFGGVTIPKSFNVWTLVTTLHTDPENWGPDSYQFNPKRFENGVTGACKFPHLYMPFGFGPRLCLGQNLAVTELKMVIAMILSNFSFSLSPEYVHEPYLNMVIEPRHGVSLLMKML